MASWQYKGAPIRPGDEGYYVNTPNRAVDRHNVLLEDQCGNTMLLWVHEIVMNFQMAGQRAQSHRMAEWYPRNFVAPTVTLTGQTQNQKQYAHIAEWIRRTQYYALRWKNAGEYTVKLSIPDNGNKVLGHYHQGHTLRGYIRNIERRTERFVNAPQFSFEFIVATAETGLYEIQTSDPSVTKKRLAMYLQFPEGLNRVLDPDPKHIYRDPKTGEVTESNIPPNKI